MFITSKRGAQDNIVTYEHICDTTEDLQKIDPHYITLGSTCIIVQGENGGVDAYIATSDKQWVPLGSGSGSSEEDTKKYEDSDVRFIDYDGKVVYGYSAEEFLQLSKMPKNPNHKNDKIPLTAQGWNWDIEDAKEYVSKYGMLDIGQMYIPSDGKTHMIVEIKERLTIPLIIQQTVSQGVAINWGDNSEEETIEGTGIVTTSHTYASEGEYDITLEVIDGCELGFGEGQHNTKFLYGRANLFKEIYLGKNIINITDYAFGISFNLTKVIIPQGVKTIGLQSFTNCHSFCSAIIIPNGVTTIKNNAFMSCEKCTKISIPNSVVSLATSSLYYAAKNVDRIVIPDSVESMGNAAFCACNAAKNIIIPDSISVINLNTFYGCNSIEKLIIPNTITSIGNSAFSTCRKLKQIIFPEHLTTIGQDCFSGCNLLEQIEIPSSITKIQQGAFSSCIMLTNLVISENITSIGAQAFSNCVSLQKLYLLPQTPPSIVYNSSEITQILNSFYGISSNCIIYVPHGKGDVYKAANGWSNYASQIQELPE